MGGACPGDARARTGTHPSGRPFSSPEHGGAARVADAPLSQNECDLQTARPVHRFLTDKHTQRHTLTYAGSLSALLRPPGASLPSQSSWTHESPLCLGSSCSRIFIAAYYLFFLWNTTQKLSQGPHLQSPYVIEQPSSLTSILNHLNASSNQYNLSMYLIDKSLLPPPECKLHEDRDSCLFTLPWDPQFVKQCLTYRRPLINI